MSGLACRFRNTRGRKVSIAVVAAADACRHLAMIAWMTSGKLPPWDAPATALIIQVCSESLIFTSSARRCSTGPASSGGRDDIEGLFRS